MKAWRGAGLQGLLRSLVVVLLLAEQQEIVFPNFEKDGVS